MTVEELIGQLSQYPFFMNVELESNNKLSDPHVCISLETGKVRIFADDRIDKDGCVHL